MGVLWFGVRWYIIEAFWDPNITSIIFGLTETLTTSFWGGEGGGGGGRIALPASLRTRLILRDIKDKRQSNEVKTFVPNLC